MMIFRALAFAFAMLATLGGAHAETYSDQALADLRFQIEEEKLAGDVYRYFGTLYPTIKPFQNIPKSEATHYNALVGQANLIGLDVTDLTSLTAGQYLDADLQSLYGTLLAYGRTSAYAALTVGKNIEIKDIDDLNLAMDRIPDASSLYTVYGNLRNGSYNHLNAFNTWLAITPAPPVPEPEIYAMLLAGLGLIRLLGSRRSTGRKAAVAGIDAVLEPAA